MPPLRQLLAALFLCAAFSTVLAPVAAADEGVAPWQSFFVAPGGDDVNPGTQELPFRTLERAQAAVRAVATGMQGDVVVYLREGRYDLAQTLVLDARDSGQNGHQTVWASYPGERAVVSGGRSLTDWQYVADRNGHPVFATAVPGLTTQHLYVNGVRLPRASGSFPRGATKTSYGYVLPTTAMEQWDPTHVEFVYNVGWRQLRVGVERFEGPNVYMKQPVWGAIGELCCRLDIAPPIRVENAKPLLDRPGEWYLDRAEERLYYMPRPGEEPGSADIVAPVLTNLIDARGTLDAPVHDVSFRDLSFQFSTWLSPNRGDLIGMLHANFYRDVKPTGALGAWSVKVPAAVTLRAAHRVTLSGSSFSRLGGSGLNVEYGSQNNAVVANDFTDISSSAVQIGDVNDHHPTDARQIVLGNRIENNYIHDIAVEYQGGVGIFGGFVRDTTIAHNELARLPLNGIDLGWGWGLVDKDDTPTVAGGNRVTQNYIHDYMRVLEDGGAVHVLGAQPGLVIEANVVENQGNKFGALYLDDGARYATVTRNVVWRSNGWPFLFKGHDHVIQSNYWDADWRFGWKYLQSGDVRSNRLITRLDQAPADILAGAGIEEPFRSLLGAEAVDPGGSAARSLLGTADRDVLRGTMLADRMRGYDGDDKLVGRGGRDLLMGGAGADVLKGGNGRDVLFGGGGNDRLAGGIGRDVVRAGAGNDVIYAADRRRDVILCGPGRDFVLAARSDFVSASCEIVRRRG